MKGLFLSVLVSVVLGFSLGYFFAGTAVHTIHFRKDVQFQEVRDSYFQRCEVQGATLRSDGVTEEAWSCPHTKLFLIKRYTTIASEPLNAKTK